MTNLEWIRTLSAEELADWIYDKWLSRLQYRWSSSRGGLIIWLKDRKTENCSEIPNNFDKDINVRSKDEPQTHDICTNTHECVKDTHDKTESDSEKPNNSTRSKMEQVEDEPQTPMCETCRYDEPNNPKCDECIVGEDKPSNYEPQTERSE